MIQNEYSSKGQDIYWDDISMVPFIIDRKRNIFISFDDRKSLSEKMKVMQNLKIFKYSYTIEKYKSMKEFEITTKMNNYIKETKTDVKIINMVNEEDFILSSPVGEMMNKVNMCKENYVMQILNQLKIGQKVGYVHRDIRINNIILFDNKYAYLLDWDLAVFNGFKGIYGGSFLTASTPVLRQYASSNGNEVSAYYADDWISIIYLLLLCHCPKNEEEWLMDAVDESEPMCLIHDRKNIFNKWSNFIKSS